MAEIHPKHALNWYMNKLLSKFLVTVSAHFPFVYFARIHPYFIQTLHVALYLCSEGSRFIMVLILAFVPWIVIPTVASGLKHLCFILILTLMDRWFQQTTVSVVHDEHTKGYYYSSTNIHVSAESGYKRFIIGRIKGLSKGHI